MRVFQIKGLSGMLMLALAIVAAIGVVIAFPASFMMVLWNAVVFEGFNGPEINIWQGIILWLIAMIIIKLVVNPQFSFHFRRVGNGAEIDAPIREIKKSKSED